MTPYKDYGYFDMYENHAHVYISKPLLQLLDHQSNRSILDMGCGNGSLVRFLLERGYDSYGVDASVSGIDIASRAHPDRFGLVDFSEPVLPEQFKERSFDTILSTEVIEHLYDPRAFIKLCKGILPPGGQIILSTPYHGYLKNLLISITGKWDKHMNPLWDGGHIKLWSGNTLTALLEEQGFKVTAFSGCGRIPYLWKSMLIKAVLPNNG
jgi:2-polyprenyl-3-methyl-5-hydroxy-6-metoxy-1,4-benzoquinol methylase